MIDPLVSQHIDDIAELCRRYQVRRLDLFGSAATERFDPQSSDLDFLVTYLPDADPDPWFRKYLELQQALTELLGRPVDLVFDQPFRNPYFAQAVEETRTPLYAA
jgi:hypothetical protein